MKDQTQPTQNLMNHGIEDSLSKKGPGRPKKSTESDPLNELSNLRSETIIDFMNRVELSKNSEEIIEAGEHIIKHFQPRGLGANPWFNYKGIIVCPEGKKEEVERIMNMTHEELLHGASKLTGALHDD